jgi:hypothetical protein
MVAFFADNKRSVSQMRSWFVCIIGWVRETAKQLSVTLLCATHERSWESTQSVWLTNLKTKKIPCGGLLSLEKYIWAVALLASIRHKFDAQSVCLTAHIRERA